MIRFYKTVLPLIDELDPIIEWTGFYPMQYPSWYKQKWVDTDRYDIVEKPEYRQRLIENKEAEIKKLDQLHQERKDRLLKELDELKNKI